jgi:hypothetical protein
MNALENEDASITSAILIHWMLFASVFIYGGLAYALSTIMDEAPADASLFTVMVIVMSGVSLLVFASVLFFRKYWISPQSLADHDDLDEAESQYVTAMIVQGGLMESIAIYGLVLCILFLSFLIFLPFGVVSLFLFVMFRPSEDDFRKRLERAGWNPSQAAAQNTES